MVAVDAKTRMAIELVLQDLATKDLKKFDTLVGKATKKGTRGFGRMGEAVDKAGKSIRFMTLALGAAAAAVVAFKIRKGTRDFLDFGEAMSGVSTIFEGTPRDLKETGDAIRDLALSFGLDEIKVANAAFEVFQANIGSTAQSMIVLDQATELAVASTSSVGDSVDLLTSLLNSFHIEVSKNSVKTLSDLTFRAVDLGDIVIPELAQSFARATFVGASLGVELKELLAVIATLTAGGLPPAEAITGLRAVMLSLINPTTDAKELLNKLFQGELPSAIIKAEGLIGVITRVKEEFGGNNEALSALFGNVRALGPIMALSGKSADKFLEILEALGEEADTTGDALDKQLLSPARRLKIVINGLDQGFEDLAETLIEDLLPAEQSIDDVREAAKELKAAISELAPIFRSAIGGFASLGVVAINFAQAIGQVQGFLGRDVTDELAALDAVKGRLQDLADRFNDAGESAEEAGIKFGDIEELDIGETVVTAPFGDPEEVKEAQATFSDGWKTAFQEVEQALTESSLGEETAFQVFGALESGFDTLSRDLVEGEANFSRFAESLIKDIAAIAIKLLLLRGFRGLFGFDSFASSPTPAAAGGGMLTGNGFSDGSSFATGGIMPGNRLPINAYQQGGIADRPQLAVFGEGNSAGGEAFVPLGPSRKIGVQIKGNDLPGQGPSQGNTINLVVNSIDPRGAAEVILNEMPAIEKALAKSLVAGRTRALTTAVRTVSRGGI